MSELHQYITLWIRAVNHYGIQADSDGEYHLSKVENTRVQRYIKAYSRR